MSIKRREVQMKVDMANVDYDESEDEGLDSEQVQMLKAQFKRRGSTGVLNLAGTSTSLTIEKMRELVKDFFAKKEKDIKKPFISKMEMKLQGLRT